MNFRRIHTDLTWWFCVFYSAKTGEYILNAALREEGWPEIAMRLTAEEIALFKNDPTKFLILAHDFITSHNSPPYNARKISFRSLGPDVIEVQ